MSGADERSARVSVRTESATNRSNGVERSNQRRTFVDASNVGVKCGRASVDEREESRIMLTANNI